MKITENDLGQIAKLAYLDSQLTKEFHLIDDINAIMSFANQLQQIDTSTTSPLFHPLDLPQRLRKDEITEKDEREQLAKTASLFEEGLFLVPKVIDSGL